MSVVIIGGHDRMVCNYKNICKQHKCKAKIFTQMPGDFKKQIGNPDLCVLFTNTVSHKMVKCAVEEAKKKEADVVGHAFNPSTWKTNEGECLSVLRSAWSSF